MYKPTNSIWLKLTDGMHLSKLHTIIVLTALTVFSLSGFGEESIEISVQYPSTYEGADYLGLKDGEEKRFTLRRSKEGASYLYAIDGYETIYGGYRQGKVKMSGITVTPEQLGPEMTQFLDSLLDSRPENQWKIQLHDSVEPIQVREWKLEINPELGRIELAWANRMTIKSRNHTVEIKYALGDDDFRSRTFNLKDFKLDTVTKSGLLPKEDKPPLSNNARYQLNKLAENIITVMKSSRRTAPERDKANSARHAIIAQFGGIDKVAKSLELAMVEVTDTDLIDLTYQETAHFENGGNIRAYQEVYFLSERIKRLEDIRNNARSKAEKDAATRILLQIMSEEGQYSPTPFHLDNTLEDFEASLEKKVADAKKASGLEREWLALRRENTEEIRKQEKGAGLSQEYGAKERQLRRQVFESKFKTRALLDSAQKMIGAGTFTATLGVVISVAFNPELVQSLPSFSLIPMLVGTGYGIYFSTEVPGIVKRSWLRGNLALQGTKKWFTKRNRSTTNDTSCGKVLEKIAR